MKSISHNSVIFREDDIQIGAIISGHAMQNVSNNRQCFHKWMMDMNECDIYDVHIII